MKDNSPELKKSLKQKNGMEDPAAKIYLNLKPVIQIIMM
jgi:hypothetical protein